MVGGCIARFRRRHRDAAARLDGRARAMLWRPAMEQGRRGAALPAAAWDAAVAAVLAAGVVALVLRRAPVLDYADEAYVLFEAKRLLEGEVLYRDVFEIITPLFLWLTTGLYALFGVHIGVARGLAAGLQAGLALTAYGACRLLGVRRGLAAAGAAAAIAVAQPFWPIASPHWQSSLLAQGFLVALLGLQRRRWSVRWLVRGAILGALAATQQQKAVPFALLGLAVLAFDLATAPPPGGLGRAAGRAALAFALGTLAVLGPVLAIAVAQAGLAPVYEALVRFPLVEYRRANRIAWGADIFPDARKQAAVVRALPWVMALLAPRLALAGARRDWAAARGPFVLLATGGAAVASIAYFPDIIHLAFVAGIFAIGLTDCVEHGVRAAARWRPVLASAAPLLAAAGLAWSAFELQRAAAWSQADATARLDTAFGTVAAHPLHLHALAYPEVQAMVDRDPDRLLFAYPWMTSLYLMTGARNPTPYQCMQPNYLTPARVAAALAAVEAARVRTVVVSDWGLTPPPAVTQYLAAHYRVISGPLGLPPATIYERIAP